MRTVTITLDDETARWADTEAAKRDMTVSMLVADLLRQHVEHQGHHERAQRSYLHRPVTALMSGPGAYPSRDELHDR